MNKQAVGKGLSSQTEAAHSAPTQPWWYKSSERSVRARPRPSVNHRSSGKHRTAKSTHKPSKTPPRTRHDDTMFAMDSSSPEPSHSDNPSLSSAQHTKLSESELSSLRDTVSVKSAPLVRVSRDRHSPGSSVEDRPSSLSLRNQTDISALIKLKQ
mgnify:CR=1 FL=1